MLRDAQQDAPAAYCDRCGAEIYGETEPDEYIHGGVFCEECRWEFESRNGLYAYMLAFPDKLLTFMRDQLGEDDMDPFFNAFKDWVGADFQDWIRS